MLLLKLSFQIIASVLLASLPFIVSEVTILKSLQVIYDKFPLKIRGSGFDADVRDIILEIVASGPMPKLGLDFLNVDVKPPKFLIRGIGVDADGHDIILEVWDQPSLKVEKDFLISKDADGGGINLQLVENRTTWVDLLVYRRSPVPLILLAVRFRTDLTKNLLAEPIIIAQVLSTPSVEKQENNVICSSITNELRINGVGFYHAKKMDLFFSPPLVKGVDYEDVTKYPLFDNQVVLRRRHNQKWGVKKGPLTVISIDTGGGPLKLNGDEGVKIGDVIVTSSATVEVSAGRQPLYSDQTHLVISGTGFNQIGNTLRFANGIIGNNVDYFTLQTTNIAIVLRIVPGHFWRKDNENLPGVLNLVAINTGEGFVGVGPNTVDEGRDVALVFERPTAFSDNTKLFRTHSHELHIKGRGFPSTISGYKTLLKFAPPLMLDLDYTIRVLDRTEIEVTLCDGRAWRANSGLLKVVAINTRGDEAGWIVLPEDGVHVAEILDDVDAVTTGGVEVFPMGVKVYKSAFNQKIQISGTGFKEGMSFTFAPDMKLGIDYDLEIVSKNMITLRLKAGKNGETTLDSSSPRASALTKSSTTWLVQRASLSPSCWLIQW